VTKQETAQFLAEIRILYPNFFPHATVDDAKRVTHTWHRELADVPYELAVKARTRHIHESPYPPSIADICRRVDADNQAARKAAIDDAWNKLDKATSNLYSEEHTFQTLPEVCQRFVGSPKELRNLSNIDAIMFQSMTQKAFREFAASDSAILAISVNVSGAPPALPSAPQRQPLDAGV
jgi:hypothetical protein